MGPWNAECRVLEEVKRQVGLHCHDHARLIERVFDHQSELLTKLPKELLAREKAAAKLGQELAQTKEERRALTEMMRPLQEGRARLQAEAEAAQSQVRRAAPRTSARSPHQPSQGRPP